MPEFIVALPDSLRTFTQMERGLFFAATPGPVGAEVAIQNAIDDLPPEGGIVRIMAGAYTLNKAAGQNYCFALTGSNKHIILEPGAILTLADSQFESAAGAVVQIGEEGFPVPVPTEVNLSLWGAGIIDGNEANLNALAAGVKSSAHTHRFRIGGGLTIQNCESNPLSLNGRSVGGDPTDYSMKHTIIDSLHVIDSTEGVFLVRMKHTTINHLHIENISAQDGLEPIGCDGLTMSDSVIRDTFGSALDIFASGAGTTDSDHVYTNCIFGPLKSGGLNVVAIGVGGVAAHVNLELNGCRIIMMNALRGIYAGASGAGSSTVVGLAIKNCPIDGTGAQAGADGIVVGIDATETSVAVNHISNCPGNAMDFSANPAKLHVKSNDGWGNGGGIIASAGADYIATANDFT